MSRYRVEDYNADRVLLSTATRTTRAQADRLANVLIGASPANGCHELMIVDTFDGDRVVRHWINGTEEDVS